MQFQADVLEHALGSGPRSSETTALGAAFADQYLSAGLWKDRKEIAEIWQPDTIFEPQMDASTRSVLMEGWKSAVAAARMFGKRS